MLKIKMTGVVVLFVLYIQNGYSYPQGFLPKFATWNNNEGSFSILPNVKVDSPVKSPFINIFSRKKITDTRPSNQEDTSNIGKSGKKSEEVIIKTNAPNIYSNQKENKDISLETTPQTKSSEKLQKLEQTSDKSTNIYEYVTNNQIDETDSTTETTTDDYETTTMEYELLNRSSPQLVASLLG